MFKKRFFSSLFLSLFLLSLPLAFISGAGFGSGIENPLSAENFTELVGNIIDWLVKIGIGVAIIMIIYSGLLFMTAAGNEEKISKAKKALIWSLIGLAVLTMGKAWISLIQSILGAS